MLNKLIYISVTALLGLSIGFGAVSGTYFVYTKVADSWSAADAQYDAQNACVKEMVQTVERINIAVGNGTCWEEENGYYK